MRKTIYFDYTEMKPGQNDENIPLELKQLEEQLAPSGLMAETANYVIGHNNYNWSLDDEFNNDKPGSYQKSAIRLEHRARKPGMEFAYSGQPIAALGDRLFSSDGKLFARVFGQGMAAGAHDKQTMRDDFVDVLDRTGDESFYFSVLAGFIEHLDSEDCSHAQSILNKCLENPKLSQELVGLHPVRTFDEGDLDRCLTALEAPDDVRAGCMMNFSGDHSMRRFLLRNCWS